MTGRLRRAILAVALAALAGACSSVTRLAYDNAGVAAVWMVDDWFDLRDGQRDWVKERFARLHAWHRVRELPACERLLHGLAARAATGIAREDARRAYDEMRVLYHRAIRQAVPDMAEFLLRLQPEQVDRLERKFAQDNADKERQGAKGTPRERREARVKRYLERVDDWIGSLTAAQRDIVRSRVEAMPDLAEEWMADRRQRQAATLELIRSRASREEVAAGLTRLLVDTETWRRPGYAARIQARDELVFAMIADLDVTLVPEQRGRLHRRIAGYAADAAQLMAANP
ncbi:MAG TPA: DUF6279 family lipoprotein [Usitatibacteraceae bacterium]|nr:DUF6279 family lipoprotein [Usitatibacteraceae bacterium]